jgi:hypothetical protein
MSGRWQYGGPTPKMSGSRKLVVATGELCLRRLPLGTGLFREVPDDRVRASRRKSSEPNLRNPSSNLRAGSQKPMPKRHPN